MLTVTLAVLLPDAAPAVWSSPFKRALDTAAPYCARLGLAPAIHDGLREFETLDTLQMRGSSCTTREAVLARYWLEADPDRRTVRFCGVGNIASTIVPATTINPAAIIQFTVLISAMAATVAMQGGNTFQTNMFSTVNTALDVAVMRLVSMPGSRSEK